ncbi:MAG TPA: rhomboid family intramembrane serine protease [Povalibacter sp.]
MDISEKNMNTTIAVAASNGVTITTSMVCCGAYLYKYRWQHLKARPLVASTLIITLTVVTFGLQVAYPEVLQAFRRDVTGLKAGEWWRLITPLFVQPGGTFQFLFNMMFLVVLLPMAERLYGARIWFLYFVPGVVGQLVNYAWSPNGGGSSTAVFGVMGSILIYVLLHRKNAPRQYPVFAMLGICGAVVMCFTHDGHGPGLLTGAVLAALICWLSPPEQPNRALHSTRENARA